MAILNGTKLRGCQTESRLELLLRAPNSGPQKRLRSSLRFAAAAATPTARSLSLISSCEIVGVNQLLRSWRKVSTCLEESVTFYTLQHLEAAVLPCHSGFPLPSEVARRLISSVSVLQSASSKSMMVAAMKRS